MRQRLDTTICRSARTWLGLLGLALLVLPVRALADGEAAHQGNALMNLHPREEVTATVNEEVVRYMGKAGDGPHPQELVGLGASATVDFGFLVPGFYPLNIFWDFINPATRVFISCNEGFSGGASYLVFNVIPLFGGAQTWVNIQAPYVPRVLCAVLAIN